MGRMTLVALGAAGALAGCGSAASATETLLTGDPARYLISIDQLVTPDFTVYEGAHAVDAQAIAGTDASAAQRLRTDGLQTASNVRYFRQVDFGTSDGPVDVITTVERFSAVSGATDVYQADIAKRDAAGETAMSAGSLGDAAHATSLVRTASNGVRAVQVTLEWRVANVVNILVVRGRYGGTRLDDALLLAHRQTANETVGR